MASQDQSDLAVVDRECIFRARAGTARTSACARGGLCKHDMSLCAHADIRLN